MKINEIMSESKKNEINEAPAGALGQIAKKAGSKIAGKLGMKGTAANLATKANVGAEANRIKQELGQFMAGSGIKKGQLELNDFIAFLNNAGFDKKTVTQVMRKYVKKPKPAEPLDTLTASLDNTISEAVTPQIVDKVIMDLVKLGFKKQAGGKQVRSKYAMTPNKATAKKTTPAASKAAGADVKNAMNVLRKAGYEVTKK